MMIANFNLENKIGRPRFIQKPFLVVDTKFEVILGILFFKISIADMSFGKKTLIWKSYTINKALSTTKIVKVIDKKNFVIAVLDVKSEIFVVHISI